jgi:hypothetical protein
LPDAYYQDWLRVAYEESTHFELLQTLLRDMGYAYGDFAAHDGLWSMCEKTADDVLARMALVPRTLEARGLDATPLIQAKLLMSASPYAKAFQPVLATIFARRGRPCGDWQPLVPVPLRRTRSGPTEALPLAGSTPCSAPLKASLQYLGTPGSGIYPKKKSIG